MVNKKCQTLLCKGTYIVGNKAGRYCTDCINANARKRYAKGKYGSGSQSSITQISEITLDSITSKSNKISNNDTESEDQSQKIISSNSITNNELINKIIDLKDNEIILNNRLKDNEIILNNRLKDNEIILIGKDSEINELKFKLLIKDKEIEELKKENNELKNKPIIKNEILIQTKTIKKSPIKMGTPPLLTDDQLEERGLPIKSQIKYNEINQQEKYVKSKFGNLRFK
jgi:hypothetical protein